MPWVCFVLVFLLACDHVLGDDSSERILLGRRLRLISDSDAIRYRSEVYSFHPDDGRSVKRTALHGMRGRMLTQSDALQVRRSLILSMDILTNACESILALMMSV